MDDGSSSRAAPGPSTSQQTGQASVFVIDEQDDAVAAGRLQRLVAYVLAAQGVTQPTEVSLRLVDRDEIRALHERDLGGSGATDVLAFPLDTPAETSAARAGAGPPTLLGDIVACPAVAAEQAAQRRADPGEELEMLAVHGVLHLLGHDHAEPDEGNRMFALTDALLADFRRSEA